MRKRNKFSIVSSFSDERIRDTKSPVEENALSAWDKLHCIVYEIEH